MENQQLRVAIGADVARRALMNQRAGLKNSWLFIARDKNGREKWRDTIDNLVVNAGLNYILDAGLSGGTPITSWFIMLISASPTVAAADVMNSHGGWTEVTAYDEANRQAWTDGGVSSQSVDNVGNEAVFTISADSTDIGGAALTSSNTKSGTTGTLYAAGAFSAGNKSLDDGDTLTVTLTATASGS